MKTVRIIIILFLVCFIQCGIIEAQDISFSVEVDQTTVVLGESTQLRMNINGTQDVAPIKLPQIDGMNVEYVGPSKKVTMTNGRMRTSVSYSYYLLPLRTGDFTIPALRLAYRGQEYTTNSVTINVVDKQQTNTSSENVRLEERIFVEMEVAKPQVYLNEGVPLRLTFYVSGINVRQVGLPDVKTIGFFMKDFDKPRQGQVDKNGMRYQAVEFVTTIYPTRTGEIIIDPAGIDVAVEIPSKDKRKNARSRLFSDEFFNHFFGNEARNISLKSNSLALKVLPLPEKGKPQDFSQAVGEFDLNVTVSPNELRSGDPITVRIKLSGEGNLKAVTMPFYKDDRYFKTYEPIIKEEKGVKILEQVIIPRSHEVKNVPALKFNYFDPTSKTYHSINKGPFSIKVKKGASGNGLSFVGLKDDDYFEANEEFGEDIIFIKESIGKIRSKGAVLYLNLFVYIFLGGLFSFVGWYYLRLRQENRLRTDKGYARKIKASKFVRTGLKKAQQCLEQGDSKQFYDILFKVLQYYLADTLNISLGMISTSLLEIQPELKKLPTSVKVLIKQILEKCDTVRFASTDLERSTMKVSMQEFEEMVQQLEKENV
ncbi:MAG: hypothetical protein ACI9F2_000806 [Lysobacterales bacterium]|jgi:hypothetical protein